MCQLSKEVEERLGKRHDSVRKWTWNNMLKILVSKFEVKSKSLSSLALKFVLNTPSRSLKHVYDLALRPPRWLGRQGFRGRERRRIELRYSPVVLLSFTLS